MSVMTKALYDALLVAPEVENKWRNQLSEHAAGAAKMIASEQYSYGFVGAALAAYGNDSIRGILTEVEKAHMFNLNQRLAAAVPAMVTPPRPFLKVVNELKRRGVM